MRWTRQADCLLAVWEIGVNDIVSFGHWLRQRRRALDLTQEALAERVGCAAETIRRFEAERLRPSRELAERLAAALELAAADHALFVKAARAAPPPPPVPRPAGSARPSTDGAVAAPPPPSGLPTGTVTLLF